jgi:hypothetical protein
MMSSIAISLIVLAIVFGAALVGMFIRPMLPKHHLNDESRNVLQLGMGLMATMAALLLSLQLGSAKTSFDTQRNELASISAQIILLDRALARCGPDAKAIRDDLRSDVSRAIDRTWPQGHPPRSEPSSTPEAADVLYDKIQGLSPSNDSQRAAKAQALTTSLSLGQTHWLMLEQESSSASLSLVAVAVSWITIIFVGFGLFAPRNATVIINLFLCAMAVSGAVFLILELYSPFEGMIQVSSEPLRNVLVHLSQ